MCESVCVDGKGHPRQVRSFAEKKCKDLILLLGFSGSRNTRKPSNLAPKHWFSFIIMVSPLLSLILKTEPNHESHSDVQLLVFCQTYSSCLWQPWQPKMLCGGLWWLVIVWPYGLWLLKVTCETASSPLRRAMWSRNTGQGTPPKLDTC